MPKAEVEVRKVEVVTAPVSDETKKLLRESSAKIADAIRTGAQSYNQKTIDKDAAEEARKVIGNDLTGMMLELRSRSEAGDEEARKAMVELGFAIGKGEDSFSMNISGHGKLGVSTALDLPGDSKSNERKEAKKKVLDYLREKFDMAETKFRRAQFDFGKVVKALKKDPKLVEAHALDVLQAEHNIVRVRKFKLTPEGTSEEYEEEEKSREE